MTTPQQSYQAPSADDFLMGGGGAPSASFLTIGTIVAGRITERPTVQQQRDMKTGENKFWPDGNPMMQLVVTVQTDDRDPQVEDDNGTRRLFVKNQMKNAIADAVRASGARGLEVGGILSVTFTHEIPHKQRGFNPIKQYTAQYVAAAAAELQTADPWAAAPPQQQYAPPAAPAQQHAAPPAPAPQQYAPAPTPAPAPAPQYAAAAPPAPAPQYAAAAPPAEQLANPAIQALVAQQQAQQAAPPLSPPPF
ncbi:hypothetical protein ACWFQ8_30015 [Streptomyces sp. NPDC055254]